MAKPKHQFQFGIEFQELILNFIISDKHGYKAIEFISEDYFAIINHAIIFRGIKSFWKQNKRIPSKPVLKETLRKLYDTREFYKALRDEDKQTINLVVDGIYTNHPKDSDVVFSNIVNFARYVNLKEQVENADLENFDRYAELSSKIQKAITLGNELDESMGIFLVQGAKDRTFQRSLGSQVIPTGWWQLNRLLNAGGLEKHSMIMLMSEEKKFKTGMLVNLAKTELGRRKRGFYVDLENGEMAIATRTDQSIIKINKKALLQGGEDEKMLKIYRKYKRIKSELVIKRFPAYKTTAIHIQAWLDKLRLEFGITFDYGIIDYGDLMGAISGRLDDDKRISDVYLDLKNLAVGNDLDYIITASHVKRDKETLKRTATRYIPADVAKAIDKTRHVDVILGLQGTDEEKENNVIRVEVVAQRDGHQGACLFWVDIENQWAKEFTKEQVKEYWAQMGKEDTGKNRKATKSDDT